MERLIDCDDASSKNSFFSFIMLIWPNANVIIVHNSEHYNIHGAQAAFWYSTGNSIFSAVVNCNVTFILAKT